MARCAAMPSSVRPTPAASPPPARSTITPASLRSSKTPETIRCFSKPPRSTSRCTEWANWGTSSEEAGHNMTARYRRLRGTAALAAVPAGAGSVYLNGVGLGGGAATTNLESFQEKKYKATIAQQYDFSCGSAALATLLTYNYDIPVSEPEVFRDMFDNGDKKVIAESGFSLLDIKNYLARRGLEANGYRAPLSKLAEVRL